MLVTTPSAPLATTSIRSGPSSSVTVVKNFPSSSTETETPSTVTTASGTVRPETRTSLLDTMLWSCGSVTRRKKGWGGSAREVTVTAKVSRLPEGSVAVTSMVLTPDDNVTSVWNRPLWATLTTWLLTTTEASGLATPCTTAALPRTVLPSAGPLTSRSGRGVSVGLGDGAGVGLGAGVTVAAGGEVGAGVGAGGGCGVGTAVAVGVGAGVEVGTGVGVETDVAVGVAAMIRAGAGVSASTGLGVGAAGRGAGEVTSGLSAPRPHPASTRSASMDSLIATA